MKNVGYRFIGAGAILALIGMVLGVMMAISQDYTLAPAHAHNNLLGWVSMAIFGLYYCVTPLAASKLIATIHFWITLAANIVFPLGIALSVTNHGDILGYVGAPLEIMSMLIFAFVVWTNGPRREQRQ